MATLQNNEPTKKTRQDAADTLALAGSAVKPSKTGIGQKVALASMALRLAKRYPVPALVLGGIAVAYYVSRRRGRSTVRTYS